jgi:hypothetical protein
MSVLEMRRVSRTYGLGAAEVHALQDIDLMVDAGAMVATNTPPPAGAGFGTAQDMATLPGGPHLAGQIAVLQQYAGPVDVIENQTVAVPGSINTYDLRGQDPHGAFGVSMLSLVSGHYPAGPGQVAVTQGVATTFSLRIGDLWHQGKQVRRVTGIVTNPQSLLDEFALVAPGQVSRPSQVTVLFTAPRGKNPASLGSLSQYLVTRHDAAASNPLNPETIVLALVTVGMLLIALVAVGGFTVLARRRLRSLGMLGALGATDRNIRLVVRVNGVLVGVVGALAGAVLAGRLAGLPAAAGIQCPPPDRPVPAAVDRDRAGDGAGRGGHLLRRLAPGPRDHQDPDRGRPVWPARAAEAGAPLGAARRDPVHHRRGLAVLFRQEQRQRRRGTCTRPRHRPAHRRDHPPGALLPGDPGQSRAAGPDRGAPGPARPGPPARPA